MINRFVLALLFVCMLASAAGCGAAPQAPADPAVPSESVTATQKGSIDINLLSYNASFMDGSFRAAYEKSIRDAAAAAAGKGINVSCEPFISGQGAGEAGQFEKAISPENDIILVNPASPSGLDSVIGKAFDSGNIYINCGIEYDSGKVLNIATDQYYLGYKAATYVGDILGPGGKVVLLNGIKGNAADEQRAAGFAKGIGERGLIVVREENHGRDAAKAERIMTDILDSGIEFDGVLTSQCAEAVLKAYRKANAPWPKAIGFGDSGEYMQMCLDINKDNKVMPYIVISDPPGIGGTALNFGLNLLLGNELKDNVYSDPEHHTIHLPSKVWYTYDNQEEYRKLAESMAPGDTITYWLSMDEVKDLFFK